MRVLVVSLTLAVVLVACGSDAADTSTADATPTPAREVATPEPTGAPEPEPSATPAADEVVDEPEDDPPTEAEELYPDVLAAEAEQRDGTWTFDVTLSSPYDSPERYADAWRVLAPDGTELGVRILTHDHAGEQPFTRSLNGVEIPDDVSVVTIEGRDQVSGWGGATVDVTLER